MVFTASDSRCFASSVSRGVASASQPLPPTRKKIPVLLIVDSLELRRAGVVSFIAPWADDNKIKIVQTGRCEALTQPAGSLLKMILLVIGAQGVMDSGLQNLIASLRGRYASVPLVLVSNREEADDVAAAVNAGALGFISMNIRPHVAMRAFTFILGGGSYFPPSALMQVRHVAASLSTVTTAVRVASGPSLTARQEDVLEWLRQGESNKSIARHLELRVSTVKVHVRQIMRKLGATNRTQAALCASELERVDKLRTSVKNDQGDTKIFQ